MAQPPAGPRLRTRDSPSAIGSIAIRIAKSLGCTVITTVGSEAKAEKARALGADHVIDVENEDARRRVKEITSGRRADVVVEVSSNSAVPVAEALHYAGFGARVVLAGVKGFKPVPDFLSDLIVVKELRVIGAFGVTSPSYRAAIRLIESGRIPVARMHTHDFPLEDAEHAIRLLNGEIPGEQSIHSCLVPSLSRSA